MLRQQEEFEEVRQTLKRVREIKKGGRSYMNKGCDTSPPKTLSLSKKLIENRRPNEFQMTEHMINLASL